MKTAWIAILAVCVWAGLILACTMSVPGRGDAEPLAVSAPPAGAQASSGERAPAWPSPSIGEQLRGALRDRSVRTNGEALPSRNAPAAGPARRAAAAKAAASALPATADRNSTGTLVSSLPEVEGDLVPDEIPEASFQTNYKVSKYAVASAEPPSAPPPPSGAPGMPQPQVPRPGFPTPIGAAPGVPGSPIGVVRTPPPGMMVTPPPAQSVYNRRFSIRPETGFR